MSAIRESVINVAGLDNFNLAQLNYGNRGRLVGR